MTTLSGHAHLAVANGAHDIFAVACAFFVLCIFVVIFK